MDALFALPLTVDGYELEQLSVEGSVRKTMLVRLRGGGEEGLGEDVTPFGMEPFGDFSPPPALDLAGEWTLGSVGEHLRGLVKFEGEVGWAAMHQYRNWAFDSAALDLALRQSGRSLPELVGREPRPLRFVNSLGLGDPPVLETITSRLALYPDLRFKLDADVRWTQELIDGIVATGAVDVVDFKGRYEFEIEDPEAMAAMYERVLRSFPEPVLFEDFDESMAALVEPYAARLSLDSPIHAVADIVTPSVNVKPSRVGSLAELFAIYAHCEANGVRMYSGGMGEIGVGRGQAQLLSSLFHPDMPNDIAPSPYNADTLAAGLPSSPLVPGAPDGFRWTQQSS
jgi:L-alanine-DL-glutamate epimerase-like enolase superfamily enzyme